MPFISSRELVNLKDDLKFSEEKNARYGKRLDEYYEETKLSNTNRKNFISDVIEAFDLKESYSYEDVIGYGEKALKYDVEKFADDVQDVAIEKRQANAKVRSDVETKQRNVRLGLKKEGK